MQSEAQREVSKWLNEERVAPINRVALATVLAELSEARRIIDASSDMRLKLLRAALDEIDALKQGAEPVADEHLIGKLQKVAAQQDRAEGCLIERDEARLLLRLLTHPAPASAEPVELIHMACIEDGELRMLSGMAIPAHDVELYALPSGKQFPPLYTRSTPASAEKDEYLKCEVCGKKAHCDCLKHEAPASAEPDKGPWSVGAGNDRTYIQSDDFTHDVRLYINGDFQSYEQLLAYANEIAGRLNKSTASAEKDAEMKQGAEPVEAVQWRNIKHVVRTLADWSFGSKDDPRWGLAWISIVNGLTAKDGPEFKLEPLTAPASGKDAALKRVVDGVKARMMSRGFYVPQDTVDLIAAIDATMKGGVIENLG